MDCTDTISFGEIIKNGDYSRIKKLVNLERQIISVMVRQFGVEIFEL